jgi:hypothetical protein
MITLGRFLVLLLATPAVALAQNTVSLLDYRTAIPAGWTPRTPASTMRLAEYTVAATNGSPAAEVVVYFFGKGQGGDVESTGQGEERIDPDELYSSRTA